MIFFTKTQILLVSRQWLDNQSRGDYLKLFTGYKSSSTRHSDIMPSISRLSLTIQIEGGPFNRFFFFVQP